MSAPKRSSILYLYDNEHDLVFFKKLAENEYNVYYSKQASETDQILEKEKIRIVITELHLPEANGVEILTDLSKKHPFVARILTSDNHDLNLTIDLFNKNIIHGYLKKPYQKAELEIILTSAFEKLALEESNKILLDELIETVKSLNERSASFEKEVRNHKQTLEQNKYLAAIIDNSEDHAVIKDLNLRWIAANKAVVELCGKKDVSELIGKTDIEIFGDYPHVQKFVKDDLYTLTLKKGEYFQDDEIVIGHDGVVHHTLVKKYPVFDELNRLIGTANISREITERKQSEEKIQKLNEELADRVEERTRELLEVNLQLKKEIKERIITAQKLNLTQYAIDNSSTPIFWLDENGNFTYWNNATLKLLGFTNGEMRNLSYSDISAHYPASNWGATSIEIKNKGTINLTDILRKSDQSNFIANVLINYNNYEGKEYFFVYALDITEQKRSEVEIKKLALAVQQSPIIILITDTKGRIQYVNPKFTDVTGYTAEEVLGENPRILNSGKFPQSFYKNLWNTILQGNAWHGELYNKKKNGEFFWESASISSIRNESNEITHFVAIQEDITEKIKVSEELKKAKEEAESANTAKSEFLANMSHEIRTPLHAILGFSELLGNTTKDNKQLNYIESIKNSSKTLLTLINDILDLSKIEAGKLTINYHYIDAFSFLTEIAGIFTFKANEKGIEFIIDISPSVPVTIYADDLRLRQVLINLIGNAIKFTEKGFVKLLVEVSEFNEEKGIDESIKSVDLIFKVHDTGIGISKEFREKIFQTFTQYEHKGQRKYEGTGLGLSISKCLVEMMNGSISFESTEGQGSIFTVALRKVQFLRDKIRTEEKHISYNKIQFKGSKLIVVDDHESNRKYITSALKGKNLDLYEAGDGVECFKIIKKIIPDLIITDLKMQGMDGFKLLRALKKDPVLAEIPVIATTATYSDTPELRKKYPFNSFIFKPVQYNNLIDELIKFLPYSSEISDLQEIKNKTTFDSIKISKKAFGQIKDIIDNELLPIWESLHEQQPLEEVEKFGKRIIEISEPDKIGILFDYATKLLSALSMFDIDNMLKLISVFPEIIKELENAAEKN